MSSYFILGAIFLIAWIYSLFSVITGEFKNSNNKLVWIALLIFLPISAFLYLFIGRKQLVQQDSQNDEDSAFEDKIEKVTTFLSFVAGAILSLKLYKYLKSTYGLSDEDHYGIWGLFIMSSITTFVFALVIIAILAAIYGLLGTKNIKKILLSILITVVAYFFVHTGINLYNKQSSKIQDSFNQANKFYQEKNYQDAFKIYLELADNNHLDEKCRVGSMYLEGEGVIQNYIEAFKWFQLCSKQNNANADNNLGYMYINGYGVKQSDQEAFKYFKKASDANDTMAQYNLGFMYLYGYGTDKDTQKAVELFTLSAKGGNDNAKKALQDLIDKGIK